MVIVLTGPEDAGLSTVGAALGSRLGWTFVDGDTCDTATPTERMSRGGQMDDEPRAAWLDALHGVVQQAAGRRAPLVLACTALSRDDRRRLMGGLRGVRVVWLKVSPDGLRPRVDDRLEHSGQVASLERPAPGAPGADEPAIVVDASADLDTILGYIRLEFGV